MRLTNQFSIMGRKHDLAYGLGSIWKRKLKNDRYELIENAIDKLGELEDIEDEWKTDLFTLLEALKIIKEMEMLSVYQDYKGIYYLVVNNLAIEITKEKYDILKEVL